MRGPRRFEPGSVVIVDEEEDTLSSALAEYAARQGVQCERVRLDEFSLAISLQHDGAEVRVGPDCSLLLRPSRELQSPVDEASRFAWGERFAAVWSMAALSRRPVINRPGEWGWGGRAAFSAALTEWRLAGAVRAPEAIWHGCAPAAPVLSEVAADTVFHQDLLTWRTVEHPEPDRYTRSRRMPPCRGWEQVVVVGEEPARVTDAVLDPWEVEAASVRIARNLGLQFATISWGVPDDGSEPFVARVNAFPNLAECMPVWHDVRAALLRHLLAT